MGRGHGPKPAYAELIVKVGLGVEIYEAEVDLLPDPDLFRDAWLLASWGTFSPRDLDDMDPILLSLVRRLKRALGKRG